MFSHRARSSRSMGSKLLRLLGESLFNPLFEKMLTAQILQGAGRTYIDGSILIFFLFGFGPYSDPYHGKTGRHTLTSNKICFSKKPGIATLSGTWSDTPAHGKIQYIPVRIPPSPPQETLESQRFRGFVMPFGRETEPPLPKRLFCMAFYGRLLLSVDIAQASEKLTTLRFFTDSVNSGRNHPYTVMAEANVMMRSWENSSRWTSPE